MAASALIKAFLHFSDLLIASLDNLPQGCLKVDYTSSQEQKVAVTNGNQTVENKRAAFGFYSARRAPPVVCSVLAWVKPLHCWGSRNPPASSDAGADAGDAPQVHVTTHNHPPLASPQFWSDTKEVKVFENLPARPKRKKGIEKELLSSGLNLWAASGKIRRSRLRPQLSSAISTSSAVPPVPLVCFVCFFHLFLLFIPELTLVSLARFERRVDASVDAFLCTAARVELFS